MPTDDLFLENLDELINDENKVVTYKSLSYILQVQCNVAKQMLYAFLTQERTKKGDDALSATYFISGLTTPDSDGEQVFKCIVTKEEKLQEWKKSFAVVTSCHLYSIQKAKLKDSNPLYMSDYEKFKENVFDCNKYSSIQYEKAKPRSEEDMDLLMVDVPSKETEKKPSTVKVADTSGSNKAQTKKGTQSAIANMFSKVDNKKKPPTKEEKQVKQETGKKESNKESAKGGKKGAGGMMGFLSKQKETKPTTSEAKEKIKETKKSPVKVKKEPSPAASKKSHRKEDSDDEDIFRSKKRRRTKPDIFESSSEGEEEMEAEPESPVPAREKSPEPEVIEDEEPIPPKQPSPTKESEKRETIKTSEGGQKKRRRKRKLVPKTYVDKDGFMVTEKVWESDSTNASEVEEPVKKPTPKVPTPEKGKKGSPKKKGSPGKKGQPGSGKQTSLMSFFKKS